MGKRSKKYTEAVSKIEKGKVYSKEEAVKLTEKELFDLVENTFEKLLPIYKTMTNIK